MTDITGPKTRVIPEILEEHFEELSILWSQRQAALRSPEYTVRELADLEERIEAHVQGLLVGGEEMVALVEGALAENDPSIAFAAAYSLLRLDSATARDVITNAFLAASDGALEGICQALCYGPIDEFTPWLRSQISEGSLAIKLAAAEILAVHGQLKDDAFWLDDLFGDGDPEIRCKAWRVAALVDSQEKQEQ